MTSLKVSILSFLLWTLYYSLCISNPDAGVQTELCDHIKLQVAKLFKQTMSINFCQNLQDNTHILVQCPNSGIIL